MKFSISTLLFSLLSLLTATAQTTSTFSISTNPVWTICNQFNAKEAGVTTITNLTSDTQLITWKRTVINITPTCYTEVCDLVTCYAPFVDSLEFEIEGDSSGFITVYLNNPQAVEGANALVHLKLKNAEVPSDTITIVYLFTSDLSGTKSQLPAATVKLFPNPAADYFQLGNAAAVQTVRLFSLENREVARFSANEAQLYSLAGLASGTYILALEDEKGRVFQAMEMVKQ